MFTKSQQKRIRALGGEGIVTADDLQKFSEATRRVYELMKHGQWWSAENIIYASGVREGLRRMRELRKFYTIERERIPNTNQWKYRIVR